jgi:hypothetical protein
METILEIKDYLDSKMEGFEIITTEQSIKLSIASKQQCCESWGYFWCNDNPQDFIGATLLDVTLTDDVLNEAHFQINNINPNSRSFEGGIMFVDIETNMGKLQFVAYNQHNGFYGHTVRVECKQLTHVEEDL